MNGELTLYPLRRWWWLVLLAALLAAVSTYWVVEQQPNLYATRATLMVGNSISDPDPTDADFRLGRQLAELYADVAQRDPVRDAAREELGLSSLPSYRVQVPENTQLIEIVVTDTDPRRAELVADELARQVILRGPQGATEDRQREQFIREQLSYLEQKIVETRQDIEAKQGELAELESAEQIASARADLVALDGKLQSLQSIYTSLLDSSDFEGVNTLTVVEGATLPTRPINANTWALVALAAAIGAGLGTAGAYTLEALDSTLSREGDVSRILDLPVLGRIPNYSRGPFASRNSAERGLVINDSIPVLLESFRALKTNLDFSGVDRDIRSVLIASPGPRDGKSTVAVNLALVMARSGAKALLVDGDLRRPDLHRFLDLPDSPGLSDLILGDSEFNDAVQFETASGLRILTGGQPPPNPTDILASDRMDALLKALEADDGIIVVDSPPLLLADASVLASKVDAVVLVVRLGHTKEKSAREAQVQLERAGARVVGVVLNCVDNSPSYGGYGYAYHYFSGGTERENSTRVESGPIASMRQWFANRFSTGEITDVAES